MSAGVALLVGVVPPVAAWQLLSYPYRRAHPHRSPVAQREVLLALITSLAARGPPSSAGRPGGRLASGGGVADCESQGIPVGQRCSVRPWRSGRCHLRRGRMRGDLSGGVIGSWYDLFGVVPLASVAALHLGEFVPPLVLGLFYLSLYTRRLRTLAERGRRVPGWRVASFSSGVVLMTVVQAPPLDSFADRLLIAHMVQHILIGDIASLLVVLGLTGPLLQPLLQLRFTRPMRRLAHPVVALVVWAFDLYLWHLPLLYQAAIRRDLVHAIEHACLLWFGALLWLALLGPLPKPRWFTNWARLGYVVAVRFLGAVLANVLIWAQTVFYPVYRASDAGRGLNPLSDQNIAGAIMMIEQMVLTVLLLAWLFFRFARQDEERQALVEFAAEQGVPLSERRAELAADAGTTARLRERLLAPPDADD